MRIEQLVLHNYRGFEDLELPLHRRLNVLIGQNGSGKTSLIGALREVMVDLAQTQGMQGSPHRERFFRDPSLSKFMRKGASKFTVSIDVLFQGKCFNWCVRGGGPQVSEWSPGFPLDASDRLPLLLALAPNRFGESASEQSDDTQDPYEAFDPTASRFRHFVIWFRDIENRENEIRLSDPARAEYRIPEIQAVRRALASVVESLPNAEFRRIRFTRVGDDLPPGGVMVVDKGSLTFRLDQLSEGESNLLLMVGDIAHRLAMANPEMDDPLNGEGVVLIDGIELHLHPRWQRAILPALTKTFPKVQFIVTTHSPQVIGEVPTESVVCLRNFQVVPTPPTFGRDSGSILEEVMGASSRNAATKHQMDEISQLIDREDLVEARARVADLAKSLGEDDPDLVGIRAAIDFLDPK